LTAEQFSRVKDKIGKCELSEIDYWSLPVSLSPFRLKLPEDAHLLQYITPALLNLKNRNFEPSYLDDDIISKINEYGIDSQELETLSNNCCLHSRTRAAARALLWVCNRAQRKLMSLADEANFYRETCDRTNRQWFAEVFLKCIIPGYSEKDEKIIQLMVYLMEETYTEFGAKLPLIMTLNDWQERSEAPITKSESMNSWLNYRFVD
jgi:hypothetical protein